MLCQVPGAEATPVRGSPRQRVPSSCEPQTGGASTMDAGVAEPSRSSLRRFSIPASGRGLPHPVSPRAQVWLAIHKRTRSEQLLPGPWRAGSNRQPELQRLPPEDTRMGWLTPYLGSGIKSTTTAPSLAFPYLPRVTMMSRKSAGSSTGSPRPNEYTPYMTPANVAPTGGATVRWCAGTKEEWYSFPAQILML